MVAIMVAARRLKMISKILVKADLRENDAGEYG